MSGRQEFLVFVGVALSTVVGLFAVQSLAASRLDLAYHAEIAGRGPSEIVTQARADEAARLGGIDAAMRKVAKSRGGDALIAPSQSGDLSAMSGWIHHPDFAPYEPSVAAAPAPSENPTQEHAQ